MLIAHTRKCHNLRYLIAEVVRLYAYANSVRVRLLFSAYTHIRESVDSLCRDDADMPMPPYIGKACNRPNAAFVSLFR